MKRCTFFGICCLLLLFSSVIVHGQAVTILEPIPVSQARSLPKDSWVVLSGNIVNTLPGGKYYTFRDSSGEITVEIEPKVWRGLSVDPTDRIVISGEVEIKKGQVSIEVKAVSGPGRTNTRQGQPVTITQPITINDARKLPDGSWVIITGNIVNSIGKEKYTVRDSSGEITVEIEREALRGLSVNISDRVEIHGKLEIKKGQVLIEAKAVRKI